MFEYQETRVNNNTRAIEHKKLIVPPSRLQAGRFNENIRGAEYFDEVLLDVKLSPSYNSFKARVKKEYFCTATT